MADILSSTFPALSHVKRIERRVRRNNCLICPFACRCPNHSRLIQKMQAWMSEGLLRWGGAFHWLWTAVPLVITALNLAGRSSTPPDWAPQSNKVLLLELEILPGFDKPEDWRSIIMRHCFFTAQPCMRQAASESGTPASDGCTGNLKWAQKWPPPCKSDNSTSFEGCFAGHRLLRCHAAPMTNFGKSSHISSEICDCYHGSSDLIFVCDTRAHPEGVYILIFTRYQHVDSYLWPSAFTSRDKFN